MDRTHEEHDPGEQASWKLRGVTALPAPFTGCSTHDAGDVLTKLGDMKVKCQSKAKSVKTIWKRAKRGESSGKPRTGCGAFEDWSVPDMDYSVGCWSSNRYVRWAAFGCAADFGSSYVLNSNTSG